MAEQGKWDIPLSDNWSQTQSHHQGRRTWYYRGNNKKDANVNPKLVSFIKIKKGRLKDCFMTHSPYYQPW